MHNLVEFHKKLISRRTFVCPPPKLASESVKKILAISMQNPALNASTAPKGDGGHLARVSTRVKVIDCKDHSQLLQNPFGEEFKNWIKIDLAKTRVLVDQKGFRFDKNSSSGWLGELLTCVNNYFFGDPHNKVIVGDQEMSSEEALNTVWHPKSAGKGTKPDLVFKSHNFSTSFDQEEHTLVSSKVSQEVKNMPSNFKTISTVASENKTISLAEQAKYVNHLSLLEQSTELVNETIFVKKNVVSASVVAFPSEILAKSTLKESTIFHDQTFFDLDSGSAQAMEEAANYLTNSPNAEG